MHANYSLRFVLGAYLDPSKSIKHDGHIGLSLLVELRRESRVREGAHSLLQHILGVGHVNFEWGWESTEGSLQEIFASLQAVVLYLHLPHAQRTSRAVSRIEIIPPALHRNNNIRHHTHWQMFTQCVREQVAGVCMHDLASSLLTAPFG